MSFFFVVADQPEPVGLARKIVKSGVSRSYPGKLCHSNSTGEEMVAKNHNCTFLET